jgi:chromosome partitioning protein
VSILLYKITISQHLIVILYRNIIIILHVSDVSSLRKNKMYLPPVTKAEIRELVEKQVKLQHELKNVFNTPDSEKKINKRYKPVDAAELVHRSKTHIRREENKKDNELSPPPLISSNKREGYTQKQIQALRDHFGTNKVLSDQDEPLILSVQNFKGGVSKTTVAVHLAMYLSLQGYKTLLVDLDSQASTTHTLGKIPDFDIKEEETLYSFFRDALDGKSVNFGDYVQSTYWMNLDYIPANLSLYNSEYEIAAANMGAERFALLYSGIEQVIDNYHIVIIDTPPALGMLSLNALYAAMACIIPCPPRMLDFTSTMQFFKMLDNVMGILGEDISYKFLKILPTRKKARTQNNEKINVMEDNVLELAYKHFGEYMTENIFYETAALDWASGENKTLFEVVKPKGSPQTQRNALKNINSVCREIENLICKTWPSMSEM